MTVITITAEAPDCECCGAAHSVECGVCQLCLYDARRSADPLPAA